jgi:hypothetical protein
MAVRFNTPKPPAPLVAPAAPLIAPLLVSVVIENATASTPSGPPAMLNGFRDRDRCAVAEDRAGNLVRPHDVLLPIDERSTCPSRPLQLF